MPPTLSRTQFVVGLGASAILTTASVSASRLALFDTLGALEAHRKAIARVVLYALPGNISTMIAVTPDALGHFVGVSKRILTKRVEIDALIAAFSRGKPVADQGPFDARYGVVFEGRGGARRFAAYTNAGASRGILGRHSVAFDEPSPLLSELRRASR